MGITSNLKSIASSVTGSIEKATLILGGYSSASSMAGLMDVDAAEAIQVELPFNPSTLTIRAMAGGGHIVATSNGTKYQTMDPRIEVSFTAYVDEVNTVDAFLFEKVNRGDAISLVSSAVSLIKNNKYTVAPYVEGFLAALRAESTSQIWFLWGNMEYGGALNAVSARYTMFNPSGDPIKAEIDMRITCVSKGRKNLKTEWQNKYEDAMAALTGDSTTGIDLANSSALNRFINL